MKTLKVLFSKEGNENATTPADPVCVYVEGTVDLEKTGTFCASSDFDMLVTERIYEVHEVTLPDWLDPKEWIVNRVAWKYLWGQGVSADLPEAWQRGLLGLSSVEKHVAGKLLKTKKFRSAFRAQLRVQLVAWLETPAEERKFRSPLSPRQWEALMGPYDRLTADRTDTGLYRNRYYRGVPTAS